MLCRLAPPTPPGRAAIPADDLLARARAVAAERAAAGAGANLAIIKRGLRAPLLEQLAITTPTSLL